MMTNHRERWSIEEFLETVISKDGFFYAFAERMGKNDMDFLNGTRHFT